MPNLDILMLTLDVMMLNQTKKNAFSEMLPDIRTGLDFLKIGLKKLRRAFAQSVSDQMKIDSDSPKYLFSLL